MIFSVPIVLGVTAWWARRSIVELLAFNSKLGIRLEAGLAPMLSEVFSNSVFTRLVFRAQACKAWANRSQKTC